MRLSYRSLALLAALLAAPFGYASAQNVILDAPALFPPKGKAGPPDVRVPPAVWPRLDPGAVLCRTQGDLVRLAANRSGGPDGGPADCRIINIPTGIKIIQRQGPGSTQVQVTGGSSQVGWTDAWLPEKAPPNVKAAATGR
ncbi:MAG: hypothetical protein P4L71_14035 [Acetobacteraceae bacterium]|nr:hypothetical protein [Acetobacteraceae bacterium]